MSRTPPEVNEKEHAVGLSGEGKKTTIERLGKEGVSWEDMKESSRENLDDNALHLLDVVESL